jgi:nucleoside-diphosphate-sugar epimerase
MIVVTGASGFIGHHLVQALAERIPEQSIQIFDAKPSSGVLPERVQFVRGTVEDTQSLAAALHGADVVVHLAAKVQPDSHEVQEMRRVNVEGTRNVYSEAVASGCSLFVHMSSAGVYGPPRSATPFQEDDAPRPVTPYQLTKWEAEEALRSIDAKGTTLNIFRPAGIYGPGSHLEIPAFKRVIAQRWAVEMSGGVSVHPTHVRDVVEAIIAVVRRPAPHGMVFNVGGARPIRLEDWQAVVADALGVRRQRLVIPSWIGGPLAAVAQPGIAFMGRRNPLLVRMGRGHLFSAAVDDRRFRQRYPNVPVVDLTKGVKEHVEWAKTNHLL